LRDSARAFLKARSGAEAVRKAMDSELGYDREAYAQAMELGWAMVSVPEELDGIGLGDRALATLMFEMGRVVFCGPFLSTVGWALPTLLAGGSEELKARWVPELAGGAALATVVDLDSGAERSGELWSLRGEGRAIDGSSADLFLVRAGGSVFAVEAGQLTRRALRTMDQTRRLCGVALDLSLPDSCRLADGAWEAGQRHGMVALAAEQAGGAAACVDMAAEYAGVRRQFGKPIGVFQAVAHKCADMFLLSTSAWSAAESAAQALDARAADAHTHALVAKTYASDAYYQCAAENIQVHGGIGFTWEHDAHLHFKRARAGKGLFGEPRAHRESIAASLLD
jgi:alkylation response protein AidB-like acyl-CoA dehydrogenase